MSGLKIIDGTPTTISKYLREEKLKQKARATIEHMKQPHFINKNKETELLELLKDIEEYKFNWTCDCESCSNIKKKILKYTF